jgi:ParE toxin of type II toxin-antitoxin system, parDE
MIVEFLPEAKSELLHAVQYYEGQLLGLGRRFWDEVDQHINWIAENPEVPQLRSGGYRRVNLRIFPYYVAYIVRDPVIWILSIAHGHSLPEYWIDRTP